MFWFGIQTYTGSECVHQMLKAIWPSLAHLHNGLSPGANITTLGLSCLSCGVAAADADIRVRIDVLLPVLAHSVPFHPRPTAEDPLALCGRIVRRPPSVVRHAYLVPRQGPVEGRPVQSLQRAFRQHPDVRVAERAEQRVGHLRYSRREHPRPHDTHFSRCDKDRSK